MKILQRPIALFTAVFQIKGRRFQGHRAPEGRGPKAARWTRPRSQSSDLWDPSIPIAAAHAVSADSVACVVTYRSGGGFEAIIEMDGWKVRIQGRTLAEAGELVRDVFQRTLPLHVCCGRCRPLTAAEASNLRTIGRVEDGVVCAADLLSRLGQESLSGRRPSPFDVR